MVQGQKAHDLAALCVHPDGRAKRIHHIDAFGLGQLPGARGKGIGFGHQRAHRAQINDIALQVRIERFPQV